MQDITLGDTSVRVNDGSYHVVRFIRTGANATLQIDDFKTQRKNPLGRQLLVFNTQNQLQIGGKWNPGIGVDRPFIGNLNKKIPITRWRCGQFLKSCQALLWPSRGKSLLELWGTTFLPD